MRLLHTSDWHLGGTLNERSRREEMQLFLDFLRQTIVAREVEVLVLSGDVFDTASPSSEAEAMYYNFLVSLQGTCCRDVVVIAGNHDSPSKLRASKELLRLLNIHVYCNLADVEPLVLPGVIIVPIPFLRDRELLSAVEGQSIDQSNDRRKLAIETVYSNKLNQALALGLDLPVVALGHVAVSAGFSADKGLYLGGLGVLEASSFSDKFSYVALGHIHKRQEVSSNVYYCGSPIPMTFDEAKYDKSLSLVTFEGKKAQVEFVQVPCFRTLITVRGSLEEVRQQLKVLALEAKTKGEMAENIGLKGWISVQLEDNWGYGGLKEEAQALLGSCGLEVLAVKNVGAMPQLAASQSVELSSLSVEQVFEALLDEKKTEKKDELLSLFGYVLEQLKVGQDEN